MRRSSLRSASSLGLSALALLLSCGSERRFDHSGAQGGDQPEVGGAFTDDGGSTETSTAGERSRQARSDHGDAGGAQGGTAGATSVERGDGLNGGDAAVKGEAGHGPSEIECSEDDDCRVDATPYCSPSGRCVACLEDAQCPTPPNDCVEPSCDAGACGTVPKPRNMACGRATSSACDEPDRCDGAGRCLPNFKPSGYGCDDGNFCNGADTCDDGGNCVHAGDPCARAAGATICNKDTKTCSCDSSTTILIEEPPFGEEKDKEAFKKADPQCSSCRTAQKSSRRLEQDGNFHFYCSP